MKAFWLRGYEATSMANLLDATGLTSRSLYNIFGSKDGLFKAALEKYYRLGPGATLEKLEAGEGRAAVRGYVRDITSVDAPNGCFFVNTVLDKNIIEKDSLNYVRAFFERLEAAFKSKLAYARKYEGFAGNPGACAAQLTVFVQGLAVYSKMTEGVAARRKMAADFLSNMGV